MAQNKTVFDGMINRLEKICCKLSEIKDILTGNNTVNTNSTIVNTCANPVPVFFCPPEIPKIDPEVVCLSNDGGVTIVKGWEVFDVSTNPPTSKLYIGGVEVTGYTVVPCDKPMQYDYEKEVVCVNGLNYTKWYVWDKFGDTLPNLVTILWLDENDAVVAAPDPILINNANCKVCLPTISDAFANDLSTLLPGTSITITKPDCCRIQVITSAGTITLREKETYYSTTDFKCPITITGITIVSGTCSLSDIHIISNFNG